MTRINCIPVESLTDQHLIAEYRELPMIMGSLRRSKKSKKFYYSDYEYYPLNGGHVRFFYDKGGYLHKRYQELINEMKFRGFSPKEDRVADFSVFSETEMNDWRPTLIDKRTNLARIIERIEQKPDWYRYFGRRIPEDWMNTLRYTHLYCGGR